MNPTNGSLFPPAITRAAVDLKALAAQINADHQVGTEASRRGLAHFRAAGEALLKAREAVGHGQFLSWLKENVTVKKSRAYQYMRFAKFPVTGNLEDQEAAWRSCSGNGPEPDAPPGPHDQPADEVTPDVTVEALSRPCTHDWESEATEGTAEATAPQDTAAEPALDSVIPDRLRTIFEAAPLFAEAARRAGPLADLLAQVEQTPAYAKAVEGKKHTLHSTRVRDAGEVIAALRPARPCPACGGASEPCLDNDTCATCGGKGYQTAEEVKAAP
jgi:hypothetical protein